MIDARSLAKKIGLESGHGNFSRAERGDPSDTLARKQRGGPAQAARDKRASNYLKRAADLRKRERAAPKSVASPTPKGGAAHSASQPCLPTVGSGGAAAASSLESSSADDAMVSASGSAAAQAAARAALAAAQAGEPSHNGGAGIVGYTGYKSKYGGADVRDREGRFARGWKGGNGTVNDPSFSGTGISAEDMFAKKIEAKYGSPLVRGALEIESAPIGSYWDSTQHALQKAASRATAADGGGAFAAQRAQNTEKKKQLARTQWEYGALPNAARFSEHRSVAGSGAPLQHGASAGAERAAAKAEMFDRMVKFKYGEAGGEHLKWKGEEGGLGALPNKWEPPPSAFPAHGPRYRGEEREKIDFEGLAEARRAEGVANKARKQALNTAQWTTKEGRDAHYEQAPWCTEAGQSSSDMAAATRAVGAEGVRLQKQENWRRKLALNGGKDAAASITSVDAEPRSRMTSEAHASVGKGARRPAEEMIAKKQLARDLKAKLTLTTCAQVLAEDPTY